MTQHVSDLISNLSDQLANAAKVLGKSMDRRSVFRAIYAGKKKIKTKSEIVKLTGLTPIRVLQEARTLSGSHIIEPISEPGKELSYKKINPFTTNYKKVLGLDKKKLEKFPTKTNPQTYSTSQVIIRYSKKMADAKKIYVDDLDSFINVQKVSKVDGFIAIIEKDFKKGIQSILKEEGKFADWGGEKNDLFTTRVKYNGKRLTTAFAFKGKGKRGILKPSMMGKNGDQTLRLFQTEADLYVLQYWGVIDLSMHEMMENLALAKSVMKGKTIYFCLIDGTDTVRLLKAYSRYFNIRT